MMFLLDKISSETSETAGKPWKPFFPTMCNQIRIATQLRARTHDIVPPLVFGPNPN